MHTEIKNIPDTFLYTNAETRKLEQKIIKDQGISAFDLMQCAGQAAFEVLKPQLDSYRKVYLFCGCGNNGGDGFILAWHLVKYLGNSKVVCIYTKKSNRNSLVESAKEKVIEVGCTLQSYSKELEIEILSQGFSVLFIDALFGIGLNRPIEGQYLQIIQFLNSTSRHVISLDIPSGLNEKGVPLNIAVYAKEVITFINLKQGLFLEQAKDFVGKVTLCDLGVTPSQLNSVSTNYTLLSLKNLAQHLPKRNSQSHKGNFGHLLIIGGEEGMGGSVLLAAESAIRCGVGRVTVATRSLHIPSLIQRIPEIMGVSIDNARDLSKHLENKTAILIGPGLGLKKWGVQCLKLTLKTTNVPLILDADALNLLATDFSDIQFKNQSSILTPHPKEAARLLKTTTQEIQNDRKSSLQKLSQKYNANVVLKGNASMVKTLDTIVKICPVGNSCMATAGMGDVLAGVVSSFVAQGVSSGSSLDFGVYIHSAAADLCLKKSPQKRGVLASDLIENLIFILNHLFEG